MDSIISYVNDLVWSNALIVLCMGAGIYFSVVTRFVQLRYFKHMIQLLFHGKSSDKGVSSFQAFAIAISGRVGTGNIRSSYRNSHGRARGHILDVVNRFSGKCFCLY